MTKISTYDEDPDLPSSETLLKEVFQTYDVFNRWITREVDSDGDSTIDSETIFVYDGDQIVLELDGDQAADLTHRYLWGPVVDQIFADEVVSDLENEGDILWPLTDNLGTVRDLAEYDDATDETTIVDHYVYDAFGNETDHTGSNDFLFKYTGRAFDDETGLQNNLHRWFDPAVGRWLSEDPIGFEAGDANVYRYVGNFATGATDPSGLVGPAIVIPVVLGGKILVDWLFPDAAAAPANDADDARADAVTRRNRDCNAIGSVAVAATGGAVGIWGPKGAAVIIVTEAAEEGFERTTGIPAITDPKDVVEAVLKRGGKKALKEGTEATIDRARREAADSATDTAKRGGKKARDSGKNEPHVGQGKIDAATKKIQELEAEIEKFKRTQRGCEGFKQKLKELEDRLKHARLKRSGGGEGPHGRRGKG